jgi:hypothetical protein
MKVRLYVFTRLKIPASGLSSKPLVAFYNSSLLSLFKSFVFQGYKHRVLEAPAPKYHIADEAGLTWLRSFLDVFIPEPGGGDGK